MNVECKIKPALDPDFVPAVLWNRVYEAEVNRASDTGRVTLGLLRGETAVVRRTFKILPQEQEQLNFRYVERLLKTLLWAVGGNRILFDGPDTLLERLRNHYADSPLGRFDSELIGKKVYDAAIQVEKANAEEIPEPGKEGASLGRHLDGCRIGFDLGGSDRKCAAVVDGEVVFSEEIRWDPYFQNDPQYHIDGIRDSLKRAAEKMPRVDAIGGSAAGVYIRNEVRLASLFRGVEDEDFNRDIRPLFKKLKEEWGGIPFDVVNDGEVTALAGAMSLNDDAVLGISMGTSLAAGYVTSEGNITSRLNELAFVPVDYRDDGPVDEWSGDTGCGVQYFSQQAVARLIPSAGIKLESDMPFAEQLVEVQRLMAEGDERARRIYDTIGVYFGYTIAWWSAFYDVRNLLILGRVTSGEGGQVMIEKARKVLQAEFPELAKKVAISMPDEQMKRHGQAVAAASLPERGVSE